MGKKQVYIPRVPRIAIDYQYAKCDTFFGGTPRVHGMWGKSIVHGRLREIAACLRPCPKYCERHKCIVIPSRAG